MTLASESVLRDVETIAVEVDALDARDDLDEATSSKLYARRQRMLIELETFGVLAEDARPQLVAYGLGKLVEYHDAAAQLRGYLVSVPRMAALGELPPASTSLLDARISLDWFRRPGSDHGRPLSPHEFLAGCERAIKDETRSNGWVIAKFSGATHVLLYRREVADAPRLYRAGERVDGPAATTSRAVVPCAIRDYEADRICYVAFDAAHMRLGVNVMDGGEREAWLDALTAAGSWIGGTVGDADDAWAMTREEAMIWQRERSPVRLARAQLGDLLGVIATTSSVQLRRTGGRIESLVERGDARWNAYCARDLARWRGCIFVNETEADDLRDGP